MDIYGWVTDLQNELAASGNLRVAELINLLPMAVSESEPIADAYGLELLAAAKALQNPWLEVYARHWHLRHLNGTLNHGTLSLQYAVDALERAHRPEARDCPQSICATQDISSAYESVDRFSFAAEREAVSRETLAKVTPVWSCFDCINRELIGAVHDQGRTEEALGILHQACAEMAAVGEDASPAYINAEAELHLAMGNIVRTLELCELGEATADDEPRTTRFTRRINWTTALRLSHAGNLGGTDTAVPAVADEVLKQFPSPEDILSERTLSALWADELLALKEAGYLGNQPEFGATLETLLQHSERVGSLRTTIDVGYVHACLSADRGVRWVGEEAIAAMQRTLPSLIDDHGAAKKIATAQQLVAALMTPPLPAPIHELAAYIRTADSSAEQDVEWLRLALATNPQNQELQALLGMAYGNAGQDRLALQQFQAFVAVPHSSAAVIGMARSLVRTEIPAQVVDHEVLSASVRFQQFPDPGVRVLGFWLAADFQFFREQYDQAIASCKEALLLDPAVPVRPTLAKASLLRGDFLTAADQYRLLIEESEDTNFDWDLITAATAAEDWATVRAQAIKLGIPGAEGEGPIDEPMSFCRVLRPVPQGPAAVWDALRTGPATARIVEVSRPDNDTQFFNEVVVLDLEPVNLDAKEEDGDDWVPIFPVVHVLHPSRHTAWVVDGAAPPDELWATFRDVLREEGWGVWSATWPGYVVVNPAAEGDDATEGDDDNDAKGDGGGELPGMFCFVATPPHVSPQQADERLTEMTAQWPHPVAWLTLAETAGVDLARHHDIIKRYGL